MDLNVIAERGLEAHYEHLDTLRFYQHSNTGQQCLESVLVLHDSACPLAGHELA